MIPCTEHLPSTLQEAAQKHLSQSEQGPGGLMLATISHMGLRSLETGKCLHADCQFIPSHHYIFCQVPTQLTH